MANRRNEEQVNATIIRKDNDYQEAKIRLMSLTNRFSDAFTPNSINDHKRELMKTDNPHWQYKQLILPSIQVQRGSIS